jgi:N-acetylneuraminic acid mutarotase
MNVFLNRYLIIFGGAGPYIEKIQKRETFNDIQVWDTRERNWIDLRKESPEKDEIK